MSNRALKVSIHLVAWLTALWVVAPAAFATEIMTADGQMPQSNNTTGANIDNKNAVILLGQKPPEPLPPPSTSQADDLLMASYGLPPRDELMLPVPGTEDEAADPEEDPDDEVSSTTTYRILSEPDWTIDNDEFDTDAPPSTIQKLHPDQLNQDEEEPEPVIEHFYPWNDFEDPKITDFGTPDSETNPV